MLYNERVDYLQMELEQRHRLRQLDDQASGLQGLIGILVLVWRCGEDPWHFYR